MPRLRLATALLVALPALACRSPGSSPDGSASATAGPAATPAPGAAPEPESSASPTPAAPVCRDLAESGPQFPVYPLTKDFPVRGFDASSDVAWTTAKEKGITFALLQATMGGKPNATFSANWAMAAACGIKRGAYHFASPKADPEQQADVYVETAAGFGDFPPIVDVELPPGCKGPCCELTCDAWRSTVGRILARVEKRANKRPMIYTVEPFWKECLCNTSRFAEHALWLAGYPRFDPGARPGFGGWQRWTLYQTAGNVKLGKGVVDADVFRGDAAELETFLAGAAK